MGLEEELFEYVEGLQIIDTHEHLPGREEKRERETDFLKEYLEHYLSSDLVSAGLGRDQLEVARDDTVPLEERWELVQPYWDFSRHTGYARALDLSVDGLYGIEEINGDTFPAVEEKFQQSLNREDHFNFVFERAGIDLALLDEDLDCDRQLFRSVYRIDPWLFPTSFGELQARGKEVGLRIHSLRDWKEACERKLDKVLQKGAVGLKCGVAYSRSLRFERSREGEAAEEFEILFEDEHLPAWRPPAHPGKRFQDHMMHHILTLAEERELPLQVHTGIQEGNGNVIYDSNPQLLTNLLLEYEGVDFDLFHIGYPYQEELGVLVKNFPNAYVDMCWAHIISPEGSLNALSEWLEVVPLNKICAFGGDYCLIDGLYGHQLIARRNVAKALAGKVEKGIFDLARAKEISKWLLVDNPVRLFGLK